MKNKVLILLLVIFLTGCNVKTFLMKKIEINLAIYNTYQIIKYDAIDMKIKAKENFVLYLFSPYCDTCNNFKNILNTYIYKYNCEIFALNVNDDIDEVQYKTAPTLIIYNKGKQYIRIDLNSNYDCFLSYDCLVNFLNSNIKISSYRDIKDEVELFNVIKFDYSIIYYYYSKCSDCMYFSDNYFSNFIKGTKYKFYGFEMSKYFRNIENFYDFCDRLNLSDNNDGFGYLNGVVPMFQKYNKSVLVGECVIFNDVFEKEINENGDVISMKLISSYYDDNPFIGYVYDCKYPKKRYYESTISFFNEKFNLFLTNYI